MLVRVHSGKKYGFHSTTEQNMSWSTTHSNYNGTAPAVFIQMGFNRNVGMAKLQTG